MKPVYALAKAYKKTYRPISHNGYFQIKPCVASTETEIGKRIRHNFTVINETWWTQSSSRKYFNAKRNVMNIVNDLANAKLTEYGFKDLPYI